MTSSRRFDRLLQAGCLGLIGMLAAAGCGGSSSPGKGDTGIPDGSGGPETGTQTAQLVVVPPTLELGTIEVGVKSTPVTVTVTNKGPVASGTLTMNYTGAGIVATGCAGTSLAVNQSCTISVTAQEAVAGQFSGTIEVGDSAANTKKIAVSGVAMIQGQFSLSPSPLDLGSVKAGDKASGTVVMTNTAVAGLTDILINVGGAGFAVGPAAAGTCTQTLALGQSCNIVVNFTAGTTSGPAKGSLTVSQGGQTKTVALTALVQTPAKLAMTPPSASLPTVFGTPSAPATFYVTNIGDLPTSAAPTVAITGANKDDFNAANTCATALAGGAVASCQVTVVYNPTTLPTANATATLTVSEAGGSTVSAILTGTANPPSTLVITGVTPAPVALGDIVVGNAGVASTFTVTNTGGENSGALEISVSPASFVIAANTCADKDLASKAFCTFTAQFKPLAGDAGVINGQLKAKGAATTNPALFAITGNAIPAAKLVINPERLDFGRIPLMQESGTKTLTISNNGGAPTGALKVDNTGAQFNIKGDTCTGASLTAAGATKTCTVTVTFTATGTDVEATGSIIVTDTTAAAVTVSASLHGTGIKRSRVTLEPTSPNFGDILVGKTSAEVLFTVTNTDDTGTYPDSGTMDFAFSGDAASDFAIVKKNCTTPLLPGASCAVTVAFTPSAVGVRNAILTLTTSRDGIAQSTLEGKGVDLIELVPMGAAGTGLATGETGLALGSTPVGTTGSSLYYRVWVRGTSAADHTTTVSVALPTPSLPDFVWPSGTNACSNKTLDLSSDDPTAAIKTQNAPYQWDAANKFWFCQFQVQFAPKSGKGALSADLTATATGGGTSKLTLTGNSTGPLIVGVGPTFIKPAIIATPVAVGMTGSITLTIANKGSVAQTGLTFALSGTGAGDFQIVETDCWGVNGKVDHHAYANLPAVTLVSSCTVTLGFAPQTESKYSVTFTATAANGAGATDDETDSVNVIATGASTFGLLAVTPNPATTQFVDVAEGSTGASVTFTVTNTGTLPAKGLIVPPVAQFDILPSTGVAGACTLNDATFTLAGNAPCTIRVQPHPTAFPAGINKVAVNGNLLLITTFGTQSVGVQVPMLYYVTSNIVVKDSVGTSASGTSMAYTFPAAGVQTTQKHNFVVTNLGSAAATLEATVASPFVVETAPADTLDPPACKYGAGELAAGASCTLVLQNINNAVGVKKATLTLKDSGKHGWALVALTGTTLSASDVKVQDLAVNAPVDPNDPNKITISLGSVPSDSTTISFVGGKATVWYKNEGGIATGTLSYRWTVVTDTSETPGTAGTADPEFIIDSDETSCVGKTLQPNEKCSMSVHFKVDHEKVPAYALRTRKLELVNSGKDQAAVTFEATATETASLYIEAPGTPVKDGFFVFEGATAPGVDSAVRTFRIVNGSVDPQTFTLPAVGAPLAVGADFYIAAAPSSNACALGAVETLDPVTKSSCSFNVVFRPTGALPIMRRTSRTVGSAVLGLMGKVQQPVTLVLSATSADFDTVAVGGTASKSFTVTNTGDVGMEPSPKLSLSTAVSTATAATYAISSDACNGTRLAAGASCVITVTVTGVAYNAAPQTASLTVSNTDYLTSALSSALTVLVKNAASISVTGNGSFGQVPVTGYFERTFTVDNAANAVDSGAVTASLSGKDAAQFSYTTNCASGSGLVALGTCDVTVRFQPAALAADDNDMTAVLTVTATPGGTKTVNLSGTPVAALTISPAGTFDLVTALQEFTVTLGNTATATSALKTSLVGADFMIVSDECFAQVLSAATTSCKLRVKYTGTTSATKKSATLTVDGGSAAKKASVVVNATNIQAESH